MNRREKEWDTLDKKASQCQLKMGELSKKNPLLNKMIKIEI